MGLGRKIVGSKCYSRDEFIVNVCQDMNVLHVGCTDYPFFKEAYEKGYLLHSKISEVAETVIGIDIVDEDIKAMNDYGFNVSYVDAQYMSQDLEDKKFDIILLADVIEHITNPGMVLEESKKLLIENGKIIISVPNAFGVVRFLKSFFRYEQVHPDHLAYYSSSTLQTFAKRLNLQVVETAWYKFEVRDKRPIVYFGAWIERVVIRFCPWQAEGCLIVLQNFN